MRDSIRPSGVRRFAVAFVAALASTLSFAPALHAQEQTGTIIGRVLNVATGSYLNNAMVTVDGTELQTFTNSFGEFRLENVPAGEVTVKVFFTGLDTQSATISVPADAFVTHDFKLTNAQRYGDVTDEIISLDEFVVASARETNAAAIAQQEQRFAANIKNVVSADAFGDVTEGNVGEFVKYLPGVTVDYVAADVRTISVRGFADNFTSVNVDGAKMASAASGSAIRTFELEQVSINNVSRVEVSKVPRPEDPADSLGGSVNLISKSAFEQARRTIRYKAYLSINDENTSLFKKTPGPGQKETYKALPGFEFSYIDPISDTFGIAINALSSNQFNEQHRSQPTWRFSGAGATAAAPYLRQYQHQDGPKNTFRDSISIKTDWKVAPGHVLSAGFQYNYYKSFFGNRNTTWNVGTTNTPNPSTGAALSFGPDFTYGPAGRGSVSQGASFRDKLGATRALSLNWRFDGRDWKIDANFNTSKSKTWYRATSRGHFGGFTNTLQGVSRVLFDDISYPRIGTITALNAAGQAIDWTQQSNYRITRVSENPVDATDTFDALGLNVKRAFDFGVPVSIKFGGAVRKQTRDMKGFTDNWEFLGPDRIANNADNVSSQFLDTRYSQEDPYWGYPNLQYLDPYAMYQRFVSNPEQFRYIENSNLVSRISGSREFNEWITSGYIQAEAKFMENRLQVLGGFRYELTEDYGRGMLYDRDAVYQRDANGDFVYRRDANGNIIDADTGVSGIQPERKPEAGARNSPSEVYATRFERAAYGEKDYDGIYPSLHLNYNVTPNFIVRLAYAKTLGRPDFSNIIPNADIDEAETTIPPDPNALGTINISNVGLLPWEADNYDLQLEYYFPNAGVVSVGGFYKTLDNFFRGVDRPATLQDLEYYGLDPVYEGWRLRSTENGGTAKISGVEFNYSQPLDFLGEWGRQFQVNANGTLLHLQGEATSQFQRFIPKSGNFGLTWSKKPVIVMLKWNFRGKQRNSSQFSVSPNAYQPKFRS